MLSRPGMVGSVTTRHSAADRMNKKKTGRRRTRTGADGAQKLKPRAGHSAGGQPHLEGLLFGRGVHLDVVRVRDVVFGVDLHTDVRKPSEVLMDVPRGGGLEKSRAPCVTCVRARAVTEGVCEERERAYAVKREKNEADERVKV